MNPTEKAFCRIESLSDTAPVVRYHSGRWLLSEALSASRWLTLYWSPVGRIEVNPVVRSLEHSRPGPENGAFELEIDGQLLHHSWEWGGFEKLPADRPGQEHGALTLRHKVRPITVRLHTVVDGTAIMCRWLEITNRADRPAALSRLSVWSGRVFPGQFGEFYSGEFSKHTTAHGDYQIGYFAEGEYSAEGHFRWQNLGALPTEILGVKGQSGHGHPIVYLRDGKAGNIFTAQLAWSGNWTIRVEPWDERVHLKIGPSSTGPMRVIEPGETITTPAVHFGGMSGDLADMVQQLHEHHRRSVLLSLPEEKACRFSYNSFGYGFDQMDEDSLIKDIDIGADLGAEIYTIDAGWFSKKGETWFQTPTGIWRPGHCLPGGLDPVVRHAHKRGMLFGLWAWIEAADRNAPIIREHPDWLLQRDGQSLNNMLDLSKPQVAEWVESEIVRIVEEYKIDLFRLDYNASPGEGGYNVRHGYEENTIWRHYEAMYAIWERVRRRFPDLILENCAMGGGRTDLGMVGRFHYTWFSDFVTAPRTIQIQNTILLALPPEALGRMGGIVMNGHVGGDLELQMRMSFLLGNPALAGVWPTKEDKNPVADEVIRKTVRFFKEHVRPMLSTCRVFHHTPVIGGLQAEGWCVFEYADPKGRKAIAGLFRLAGEAATEYRFAFRGLLRDKTYKVWFANNDETISCSGRTLVEEGLMIRRPFPMSSEIVMASEQ